MTLFHSYKRVALFTFAKAQTASRKNYVQPFKELIALPEAKTALAIAISSTNSKHGFTKVPT